MTLSNPAGWATRFRTTVVLFLVAGAVAFFVGSASGNDTEEAVKPIGLNDAASVAPEAYESLEGFEGKFPAGFEFPDVNALTQAELKAAGDSAGPHYFEEGYGGTFVLSAWQCAWQQELAQALAEKSDERVTTATAELSRFYDFELTKALWDDPSHSWYSSVIEAALKGDTEALEFAIESCSLYL